eukprot:11675713-Alexandrium_andersonii.AAC.1
MGGGAMDGLVQILRRIEAVQMWPPQVLLVMVTLLDKPDQGGPAHYAHAHALSDLVQTETG